jgi:hypothetical protein
MVPKSSKVIQSPLNSVCVDLCCGGLPAMVLKPWMLGFVVGDGLLLVTVVCLRCFGQISVAGVPNSSACWVSISGSGGGSPFFVGPDPFDSQTFCPACLPLVRPLPPNSLPLVSPGRLPLVSHASSSCLQPCLPPFSRLSPLVSYSLPFVPTCLVLVSLVSRSHLSPTCFPLGSQLSPPCLPLVCVPLVHHLSPDCFPCVSHLCASEIWTPDCCWVAKLG